MLVKNWMSKEVVTVDVNDSMDKADRLFHEHNIRTLPVTEEGKLAGVVTDRDLKRASASDATSLSRHEVSYLLSRIKMAEIMTRDPVTVPPDYTVEETAEVLFENRISGVPVVDKGELVGIITKDDLFRVLVACNRSRGLQIPLIGLWLIGENRLKVQYGIYVLQKSRVEILCDGVWLG